MEKTKNFKKLVVGATYKDGCGTPVIITGAGGNGFFVYEGDNGETYSPEGFWTSSVNCLNLVELISLPNEQAYKELEAKVERGERLFRKQLRFVVIVVYSIMLYAYWEWSYKLTNGPVDGFWGWAFAHLFRTISLLAVARAFIEDKDIRGSAIWGSVVVCFIVLLLKSII